MNEGSCQNSFQPQAVVRCSCPLSPRAHEPHSHPAWPACLAPTLSQRHCTGTNDITIAREREQTRQPSAASHSPAADGLHTNAVLRDCR